MASVRVSQFLDGTVHEAEKCWYDTVRWPQWVDELREVIAVEGGWPARGSTVIWESGPAGRGRVREHVSAYEPLAGQTVEVEDDSITGTQQIAFTPVDGGVEAELSLEYRIKRRSPFTPVVDLLFVRRAMAASLARTLSRFGAELAGSREPPVG